MSNDTILLTVDGVQTEVALADLMNTAMPANADENIAIPGVFTRLPAGEYIFSNESSSLQIFGDENKGYVVQELKVVDCISREDGGDLTEFVGAEHRDMLGVSTVDFAKKVQPHVAFFCKVYGVTAGGKTLTAIMDSWAGSQFKARVTQSPNKKDPNAPFVNVKWETAERVAAA